MLIRLISILGITLAAILPGKTIALNADKEKQSKTANEKVTPEERPRLFGKNRIHHGKSSALVRPGSSLYWNDPFPGRYHRHAWNRFYSPLYYEALYGYFPAPGRTQLSLSVGSNDYMGSSVSSTAYLNKEKTMLLNMTALWEQGETWWSQRDYESFTIAPSLIWNLENTTIYLGFEHTNTKFENKKNVQQWTSDLINNKSTKNKFNSGTAGVEHNLSESLSLGFHFRNQNRNE